MSTDPAQRQGPAGHISPESSSSSAALSSPPQSPEAESPSITVNHAGAGSILAGGVGLNGVVENATGGKLLVAQPPAKERKKPGRKPKPRESVNADASSTTNTDAPKKKRKPREPRDPDAPPPQRRKKNPTSESTNNSNIKPALGIQPKVPESTPTPRPNESPFSVPSNSTSQSGNVEAIQRPTNSFFNAPPQPTPQPQSLPQPPRSSGQNYDPIRSNYDPVRETIVSHNSYNNKSPVITQTINHSSASPSISSLVDPPNQPLTSPSVQSFYNQQQQQQARLFGNDGHISVPPSPTVSRMSPVPAVVPSTSVSTTSAPKKSELVQPLAAPAMSKKSSLGAGPASTATSSRAASPKPTKAKEPKEPKDTYPTPPPLPGSGLMQLGGIGSGANDGTEFRAPTVVLHIPMNGEPNKCINFTHLAEAAYGWDALHPRLAAQRDRLARVAAAGAALERNGTSKESGDEMSLDSEGEGEGSNVEMGGMSDGRNGTDGPVKKVPKKRKMKEDEYDKHDGFVDDSELQWEEQVAAATDGFFVYSGPLVPEGENPAVDSRADGAPKRGRGRGSRGGTSRSTGGRGGGPGSRGGGTAGGPGSRGGAPQRKPRITKADRLRMEQEKHEREQLGTMASMPSSYGGVQLAGTAGIGNAPMVFNQQ